MGQLDLKFLGKPEVYHAGQALKFPTRKTLALLIYLVAAGGSHTRDTLTGLFWPDSNAQQGRAALRNTLTYLRNILDDRVARHLIIERDTLEFDFHTDFDLDLNAVAAAIQAIRAGTEQIGALQMAAQRYRGDFLAGFSLNDAPEFDQWASWQREYWHQRISLISERLSARQITAGDVTGAFDTLTHWLKLDSLNELVYQRLIQLHLATGDREAARRIFEACWAMLAAEFKAEPSPETVALAQQFSAQKLPRHAPLAPVAPRYLDIPLVGRSPEYLKLVEIYHTVRRGGAQLVSLEGEAGIGKTRLASEFLNWASAEGADVVRGRAFETGGRLPYQPIAEAWRDRLERENAPDDLLADVWLAELSRLLPELRERYPDLPPLAGDETAARTRLFEAVARLGLALAGRKPLMLFIDDIQWADVASLDLLHYAARRWTESGSPILLLFNVRAEALVAGSGLASWLAGLKRDCPLTRLTLNPLTVEDTRQLIQTLAEERKDDGQPTKGQPRKSVIDRSLSQSVSQESAVEGFSRWLFAETDGQPFFIAETIKSLLERGLLSLHHQADGRLMLHVPAATPEPGYGPGLWSMPAGVRDVIRARLAELSPNALAMLAAGAVLGQNFTFERLCQVADLNDREGLPALDELLARRLLMTANRQMRSLPLGNFVGTSQPPLGSAEPFASAITGSSFIDTYVFTHDKIRDVVYTEAGDARRRVLHCRALAVLEAIAAQHPESDRRAAELAHHALRGRQVEAAFRYSLAAGDAALKLFAIPDAIGHYEQAYQVGTELQAHRETEGPSQDWRRLFLQLGRAYELNSQMAHARTTYQTMLALAREAHHTQMECSALNRLATLTVQTNFDLDTGRALLQEAQQVAQSQGDKMGLAETQWNLAQLGVYTSDPQITLTHGRQALALARELNQKELIARSLNVVALGYSDLGQWRQTEIHAAEAAALYADLGNRALEADSLGLMANAQINYGQTQAGIKLARTVLTITQEIANPWGQVTAAIHLVEGLLDAGHYAEALTLAEQAVELAREHNLILLLPYIQLRLGATQRALLALDAARTTHLAALAANETLPSQPLAAMIHAELCADYALAGDWPAAHGHARQAVVVRADHSLTAGLIRWHETEALLRGGEVELARTNVHRFGVLVEDINHGDNNPRLRLSYLRAVAVLAQWGDDTIQAVDHLEEAAALAEAIELLGEQWSILVTLGKMYQLRGDEARARKALEQAAKIVQALAAKIDDESLKAGFLAAEPARRLFSEIK